MISKFIAIEGLDGAGKSTQIRLLTEHLHRSGVRTKFIHFPRSGEGIFGGMIAKFLRGEYGPIDQVHPQLVSLMFAADRYDFAPIMRSWLDEGYFVLVDRYVWSNIAFQCAKTPGDQNKEQLRKWILQLEYENYGIPKPDLSVYLDVPFSFTHNSLSQKREGDERSYLQGKEDIHESDMNFQQAVKAEYEKLVSSEKDITRIVCYTDSGEMKSMEEIHSAIINLI